MIDPQSQPQSLDQQSKMEIVIRQLSTFIRKRPTKQGAEKLASFARECDISFANTLLPAAHKYFKQIFAQWNKYQFDMEEHVTSFMKFYNHKIQSAGLPFLIEQFKPLKKAFEKTTKKKIPEMSTYDLKNYESSFIGVDLEVNLYANTKKKELEQSYETDVDRTLEVLQIRTNIQQQKQEQYVFKPSSTICKSNSSIIQSKQLFFKISLYYSALYQQFCESKLKGRKNDRYIKLYQKYADLDEHPTNNRDCACCIRYFEEDEDIAFPTYKQNISFFGPLSKSKTNEMQEQLTEHIVSYLNSQGGVLMIGCRRGEKEQIYPYIEEISEKDKESIESRITSYVSHIYPLITPKREIDFSFIPVRNASGWLKGVYIMRIIVVSTEPSKTYFFNYNHLSRFACQKYTGISTIDAKNIYRFMTNRYNTYNPLNRKKLPYLRDKGKSAPYLIFHNSPCFFPQKGQQIYLPDNGEVGLGQADAPHGHLNPLDRPGFKFVTLLVASKEVLDDISSIYNDKQKFETVIDEAFPSRKYALSNNTWLVWHNVKFEKLLNGIKKNKERLMIRNSKAMPLLISTLNTVGFDIHRTLAPNQIEQFKRLAFECAGQKIEHKVVDGHDYFKCPSVITAVLIYFHQANRKQKSIKFVKVPNAAANVKNKLTRNEQHHEQKQKNPEFKSPSKKEQTTEYAPSQANSQFLTSQQTEISHAQPQKMNQVYVIYKSYDIGMNLYEYYNNGWVSVHCQDGSFYQRPCNEQQLYYLQNMQY